MAEPLVVVGAGGFGREVIDVVEAINAQTTSPSGSVVGVVDDAPSEVNLERLAHRGVEFLGGTDVPLQWTREACLRRRHRQPARAARASRRRYDGAGLRPATLSTPA